MNTDARTLDHKTLTELRKRAVASVRQGQRPEDVACALGVNLRTVFRWLALYRSGGWGKLDARKRGGRPPKLEAQALKWVYDTVLGTNPLQLKFPFALWTAAMIGELIAKRFGVHLSRSSVCRLLAQMGLSAQRPLWRAYQQDPEAVPSLEGRRLPGVRRRAGAWAPRYSSAMRRGCVPTSIAAPRGAFAATPRLCPARAPASVST